MPTLARPFSRRSVTGRDKPKLPSAVQAITWSARSTKFGDLISSLVNRTEPAISLALIVCGIPDHRDCGAGASATVESGHEQNDMVRRRDPSWCLYRVLDGLRFVLCVQQATRRLGTPIRVGSRWRADRRGNRGVGDSALLNFHGTDFMGKPALAVTLCGQQGGLWAKPVDPKKVAVF
jgi:hypothetical protein